MHVLVIGGTRFVGYWLVWRLIARGDRVTLFNRGTLPDPFGDRVERIRGDRTDGSLKAHLETHAKEHDAIVDFAAFAGRETREVIDALGEHRPHYVFISTGQVYLVRLNAEWPAKESDYHGPLIDRPKDPKELEEWSYGVNKRAAEDALFATADLPFTTFRIPMVNGPKDYYRRIEGYVYRMLDRQPLILPDGGDHRVRHVYGPDVARAIADNLGKPRAMRRAFNLAQDEMPTLDEVLAKIAAFLGASPTFVRVPRKDVVAAGLAPVAVSPFSGLWMSRLDPSVAKRDLGFVHTPLDLYLERTIEAALASPPRDLPENYVKSRPLELALLKGRP